MKDSLGFTDTARIKLVIFMVVILTAIMTKPASANPVNAVYQLDVTYLRVPSSKGFSFGSWLTIHRPILG